MRFNALLAGCAGVAALAAAAAPAAAQDGDVRFFGHETFTIVSQATGSESGSITEHVRDWGRTRVEIRDTTLSMMGVSQSNRQRVIYDGDQIITVDLDTGATTVAANPMYANLVAAMDGADGVETGFAMLSAMGGSPTGETAAYAEQSCDVWSVPQMMSTVCVTAEGLTLAVDSTVGPMSSQREAVEVRLGDGGPDEAFAYDAGAATTMPSIEDIMSRMGQGG